MKIGDLRWKRRGSELEKLRDDPAWANDELNSVECGTPLWSARRADHSWAADFRRDCKYAPSSGIGGRTCLELESRLNEEIQKVLDSKTSTT